MEAGHPPKQVMHYKAGDYFGELALLKGEPRAANVIAKTKLKGLKMKEVLQAAKKCGGGESTTGAACGGDAQGG